MVDVNHDGFEDIGIGATNVTKLVVVMETILNVVLTLSLLLIFQKTKKYLTDRKIHTLLCMDRHPFLRILIWYLIISN